MPINIPIANTRNPRASLSFKMMSENEYDELNTMLNNRVKGRLEMMEQCKQVLSEYTSIEVDNDHWSKNPTTYTYALEASIESLDEECKVILNIKDNTGQHNRLFHSKKDIEEYFRQQTEHYTEILKPFTCGSCHKIQIKDGYKYCNYCKKDPWYNYIGGQSHRNSN